MTDMTISPVRTTLLRVPWPDSPWARNPPLNLFAGAIGGLWRFAPN